jgi:hypothetical protein
MPKLEIFKPDDSVYAPVCGGKKTSGGQSKTNHNTAIEGGGEKIAN